MLLARQKLCAEFLKFSNRYRGSHFLIKESTSITFLDLNFTKHLYSLPCEHESEKFHKALLLTTALGIFVSTQMTTIAQARAPRVRLGTTTLYSVLAGSTVTNTGPTTISGSAGGSVGLSPGTSFTGSASVTMSGSVHIADGAASTAKADLVTAYNDLGIPTPTILSSPDLAGRVVVAGTYKTSAGTFSNSGKLTLDAKGDPNAVFIFQAESTVITSTASSMALTNGAQACNVFWRVGSSATLGANSTFIGSVIALTSITATTGAKILGQLLARNGAVTLDTNTIINNACVTAAATTTTVKATATTVAIRSTPTTLVRRSTTTVARPTTTIARASTTSTTAATRATPTTIAGNTATTTTTPEDVLPSTGKNSGTLLVLALALICLGVMPVLALKRRNS